VLFSGHPNLRAFITHCGQNSLTEAAFAGVPVLGIPLFGDQLYNCWMAQHSKIGIQLNTRALNGPNAQELIVQALGKV
jgi:UDP:flavonoid glycosyltransferase YjiC (YdhE family)